ncbi:hypothetical protein GUITHDRAFT_102503 [Guillardia theta CCMP2712]|uniref:Uncharacterized protein n=1 Tax=Guillardia theta (strain CCMP2712) TaxID=905079 RepID=L1JTZ8_GUITC|nr:hypothetical protein GUITHDRAFT_102503 [Guillardia theta CCMP2712]EKX51887.1 hypothetical protein GUITHDRAFT_102503 [Guillardia theta CCMP2712]|eukprot:XP_005838867.1 hypothetical protein GUITHDRAFT_102503 [Guillardia theta CCMP2712]
MRSKFLIAGLVVSAIGFFLLYDEQNLEYIMDVMESGQSLWSESVAPNVVASSQPAVTKPGNVNLKLSRVQNNISKSQAFHSISHQMSRHMASNTSRSEQNITIDTITRSLLHPINSSLPPSSIVKLGSKLERLTIRSELSRQPSRNFTEARNDTRNTSSVSLGVLQRLPVPPFQQSLPKKKAWSWQRNFMNMFTTTNKEVAAVDPGLMEIHFDGRLGNWIIIYMHARIIGSYLNRSLVADKLDAVNTLREYSDADVQFLEQDKNRDNVLVADEFCGDIYQQHYLTFQPFRQDFLRIFDNRWVKKFQKELGKSDVVIHYRGASKELCEGKYGCVHQDLPSQYYDIILNSLKRQNVAGRIFVICPPQNKNDFIVQKLVKQHSVLVRSESPMRDHCLARAARIFIGDIGTFSWTIAFLSEGDQFHLPYFSSIDQGSTWLDLAELFVHDDPRYLYHDIDERKATVRASFETSKMVMERNTNFAGRVRKREYMCRQYVDEVLGRSRPATGPEKLGSYSNTLS